MSEQKQSVSVVVAAYNEESIIAENISRIVTVLEERSGVKWELILIDDGSEDNTKQIIEEASEVDSRIKFYCHWRNFGQGRALRRGFDISNGEIVITLDADLSYGPEYIWKLFDAINNKKVEIVIASAYASGGMVSNVPFYRYFLSKWGNKYLSRMSHYDISTSTCVVRAFRREVLDSVCLTSDGMELQLEVLMKASMMGYKVAEIPAQLVWAVDKTKDSEFHRVSKMKIFRAIKLYLQLGWLSSPSYFFIVTAILLLLPGMYMMLNVVWRISKAISRYLDLGEFISQAISHGMQEVFTDYVYSFFISGTLIIVSLQLLVFALLVMQNKFYYNELYKVAQQTLNKRKKDNIA